MMQPVYFDNAATSYPKPESVYQAQDNFLRHCANPGRGSHQLSLNAARTIFEARISIAEFLGIKQSERLIFTPGCTHSINMALKGLRFAEGDKVLTSALEHNSVMRPLHQLERTCSIKVHTLSYARSKVIDLEELETALKSLKPKLIIMAEGSNVTGELIDLEAVSDLCRKYRTALMIDAAQSAGFTNQDIERLGISLWCSAGHKGLMGPPGVGLLYVAPHVDLDAIISGGTGSASENFEVPASYPDHLEAGTPPGPAIAGLAAGVDWLRSVKPANVRSHELSLSKRFLDRLGSNHRFDIYGQSNAPHTGIVSFAVKDLSPDRVADLLETNWGIAVRPGLHCAALAHQSLGTLASGLVRVSFGYFNTAEQVDLLYNQLEKLPP